MSISQKNNFNLFINNCFPLIENYPVFHLTSILKRQTEEIVLAHLGLKTMGQVRDKYEGQRYYDKIYRKLITFHCLEKMSGKSVLSRFMIKANKAVNLSKVHFNGKYVSVTDFIFGEIPLIDMQTSTDTVIICIKNDYRTAYFCGSLPKEEILIKSNFIKTDNLATKNYKYLQAFDVLKPFSNV